MKNRGFTLLEILIAISILSVVMSIIYSTFSAASRNAAVVEEMADETAHTSGALGVFSHEIRGVYRYLDTSSEGFTGSKDSIMFITASPLVRDGLPHVQKVKYSFEDDTLIRRLMDIDSGTTTVSESVLIGDIEDASFSFARGNEWISEWPSARSFPDAVKMKFTYKGREREEIVPIIIVN